MLLILLCSSAASSHSFLFKDLLDQAPLDCVLLPSPTMLLCSRDGVGLSLKMF